MITIKRFLLLIIFLLLSRPTQAGTECHIQLKMGLLISPDHIRVMKMGRTIVQINNDKELFIRGDLIDLTKEQQQLVNEFSLGLRKELPEIVTIAMDSMELGFTALDKVIKGIAGTDAAKGIQDHFSALRGGLLGRFARSGDNFYLAPQGLNELDDFFQDELASQVNTVITDSLKIMLAAMGEAYTRSESAIEGQRIDLGERLELISQEVDHALNFNGERIAQKAEAFCQRFETLDAAERRLQKQIPRLRNYDILTNQLQQTD